MIGIVSKNSVLYKAADIKLLLPEVKESEEIIQFKYNLTVTLGCFYTPYDEDKKFNKLDFKNSSS